METISEKLNYLNETKTAIKDALVEKGATVEDTDTFRSYAGKITELKTGGNLNIYTQLTEPTEKEGIWIETNNTYKGLEVTIDKIKAGSLKLANIPISFFGKSVAKVGTYIYIFSGTTNYQYNILTNKYTKKANIPINFNTSYDHDIAVVGDKIYLFTLDASYIYNVSTNTYTISTINFSFYGGEQVIAVDNDIYFIGSNSGNNAPNRKYNVITGKETQNNTMPDAFTYGGLALVDKNIYILGRNV